MSSPAMLLICRYSLQGSGRPAAQEASERNSRKRSPTYWESAASISETNSALRGMRRSSAA